MADVSAGVDARIVAAVSVSVTFPIHDRPIGCKIDTYEAARYHSPRCDLPRGDGGDLWHSGLTSQDP